MIGELDAIKSGEWVTLVTSRVEECAFNLRLKSLIAGA